MAMSQKDKEREGAWLNSAMKTRGWENRDVAAATGLDPNWISQWKIANRPIPDLALFKLAQVFEASPFDVRPSLREYQQFFMTDSLLDGLSLEDQRSVLKMIDGLRAVSKGLKASTKDRKPIDKERK